MEQSCNSGLPGQVVSAVSQQATLVEQTPLARDTYRIRLHCPEIARQITPGQFFMIRPAGLTDPLLGRPFALFDVYHDDSGRPAGIDFGYVRIGKLTSLMTTWEPGQRVELWGPLGNGFPLPTGGHLMMVAGGIGQTPFLATAREALGLQSYGDPARKLAERPDNISLCYGARSADYLAGLDAFDIDGLDVQLATDDGSQGHHGFVTDLLQQSIASETPPDSIYCCGPEPMMQAVARIAAQHAIPCLLSLETPMACGFGACFSCVQRIRTAPDEWDYRRVCVEGPVFPAEQVLFS